MKLKKRGYVKSTGGYRSIITKIHKDDVDALDARAEKAGLTRSQAIRAAVAEWAKIRGGATEPRPAQAEAA